MSPEGSESRKFASVDEFEQYCRRTGQVTVKQIAFRIGKHPTTVRTAIKRGKIAPDELVRYAGLKLVPLFKECRLDEVRRFLSSKKERKDEGPG